MTTSEYWGEEAWGRRLSCPITCQLFTDPVMASDGFLYERGPIERWFQRHGTSPLTRSRIDGVFHAVPTVRAEVDAFLGSLDLERRRRWRRWARSPAFQALVDWLEPALGAATARQPVPWRRLQHESTADWTAWLRAAEALPRTAPRHRKMIAPRRAEEEEEEEKEGGMEPEGAPAARLGRQHGWSEEAMADVWHRLPDLASPGEAVLQDDADAADVDDDDDDEDVDDTAAATTRTRWTRAKLVRRATRRLLAYLRVTCAGYMMAGPTVARCAEARAWAAATAVVRHAPHLDTNLLVRTLSASFADSRPGWSLIAEVCKRAMSERPAAAAVSDTADNDDESAASSTREATIAVGGVEEEGRREEEDEEHEAEEEQYGEENNDDDQDSTWSAVSGGGLEVMREEDDGDGDNDDGHEHGGGGGYSAAAPALNVTTTFPPPDGGEVPLLPTVLGRPRARSTARAEEAAFAEAMAYVDRNGAGLFSGGDADFDDRRRRRRW